MIAFNRFSQLGLLLPFCLMAAVLWLLSGKISDAEGHYQEERVQQRVLLHQQQERRENAALLDKYQAEFKRFKQLGYFSEHSPESVLASLKTARAQFDEGLGSLDYHFLSPELLPDPMENTLSVQRLGLEVVFRTVNEAHLFDFIALIKRQSGAIFSAQSCEMSRAALIEKPRLKLRVACRFYWHSLVLKAVDET
ncbi:MAG: hypothetical protein Q9O24_05780 [Gammaproteobacteria bacterium]|nr:hypothetical protein [Gammaproteobacteria bacterium]